MIINHSPPAFPEFIHSKSIISFLIINTMRYLMRNFISFFSAILMLFNYQLFSQSNASNIQISNFYNNTEPSIAIDPSNSSNLFIGTNVSNGIHNYNGVFYTTSGVSSWIGSYKNDITRFDPSVAYNTNGGLYYAYVETNTSHNPVDEILYVMSSADHGASWNPPRHK